MNANVFILVSMLATVRGRGRGRGRVRGRGRGRGTLTPPLTLTLTLTLTTCQAFLAHYNAPKFFDELAGPEDGGSKLPRFNQVLAVGA